MVLVLAMAWACVACSPVFDWRDIRLAPANAAAVLPCKKPEHTERAIPLGGVPTQLHVAGCRAGGATFALMSAVLTEGQAVDDILAGWQQATLDNMHADAGSVRREPYRPRGGMALPHAQHLIMDGQQADGKPVQGQAVWTAHEAADGRVLLLHAVMYTQRKQDHAVDIFFETIRW